jgi:hypothetical protein
MPGKEFQRELQSAQVECDRLREENNRLRKLLTEHGIPIPEIQTQGPSLDYSVRREKALVTWIWLHTAPRFSSDLRRQSLYVQC